MSMNDTTSDMLTRIRNAIMAHYDKVNVIASKTNIGIAAILKAEGYIKNYRIMKDKSTRIIKIFLKYENENTNVIRGLKRISKPGRRVYVNCKDVPKVLNGLGISIVSTNKGILNGSECKHLNVGGEVLCYIW